jgi:hypothetical protein
MYDRPVMRVPTFSNSMGSIVTVAEVKWENNIRSNKTVVNREYQLLLVFQRFVREWDIFNFTLASSGRSRS